MTLQRYRINNCADIADDNGGYCLSEDVAELELSKWISVKDKTPTNAQSFYWVLFTDGKIKMCHLNDYRSLGGPVNYWQDLHHDDHLMDGTKYIEIIKPLSPPSE